MRLRWKRHDLHPFQYIGFRGEPHLTEYNLLMRRWGVEEHPDPWKPLAMHYPAELIEWGRRVMAPRAAAA